MGESLTSDVDVTPGLSTGDNEPSRAELLVNYEKTAPRDTCQGLVAAAAAGAVLATRLTPGAWEDAGTNEPRLRPGPGEGRPTRGRGLWPGGSRTRCRPKKGWREQTYPHAFAAVSAGGAGQAQGTLEESGGQRRVRTTLETVSRNAGAAWPVPGGAVPDSATQRVVRHGPPAALGVARAVSGGGEL